MTASLPLRIERRQQDGVAVLAPTGVLDLASYARLRDAMIKCALEVPRAVVVDIGALRVPTTPTLSVFATVWLRVSEFPGVPIVVVEPDPAVRERLGRSVGRFVPVHASVPEAITALDGPRPRYRAMVELAATPLACWFARHFAAETCQDWGCAEGLTEDALVVANALVENAIQHGDGGPELRLEFRRGLLTVAVSDGGPPFDRPAPAGSASPAGLGLMLVDGLARAWGITPQRSGGKVVWAVLRAADHAE